MAAYTKSDELHHSFFYQIAYLVNILALCSWLFLVGNKHSSTSTEVVNSVVYIEGAAAIGKIDEDFICATIDWWPPEKCDFGRCSWGNSSLLNLDLNNKILSNAIKAFSPLKIRLGGTLQDVVIYEIGNDARPCSQFAKNDSEMFGFTQGCLSMSRWDELNIFLKKAGATIIFGLNALQGKIIRQGKAIGAWDSSNSKSLMEYSIGKGYVIHGWELGNELSGGGIGTSIAVDDYANDTRTLHNVVQEVYKDSRIKPLIIAPGGFFSSDWISRFIDKSSGSLQVITHHIYNLGPGSDEHLIEKILSPNYPLGVSDTFKQLQSVIKRSKTSAVAWVGEAGGAWNSGQNLVTNTFVFSFWYLDQLGLASSFDTKTYCRQSLIGGNYGLLDTTSFIPNPDYYSALLWHRLMGRNVLSTSVTGTSKLRAYAHCSKNGAGIALLLLNLDSKTTVEMNPSVQSVISNQTSSTLKLTRLPRRGKLAMGKSTLNGRVFESVREEYHLTGENGNLQSQKVLLNGKILTVGKTGTIPSLEAIRMKYSDPIIVAPFSIVFVVMFNIQVPACN